MFDDYGRYKRQKVKVFLKYLANSAAKQAHEISNLPTSNRRQVDERDLSHIEGEVASRLASLSNERRNAIEEKINSFYSKNRYMPLEVRLKKIREQYAKMKKNKHASKSKLVELREKIARCDNLLKRITRLDSYSHKI